MNPSRLELALGVPLSPPIAMLLLALAAVAAWVFWRSRLARLEPAKRVTLMLLRIAALCLILFMLLDPIAIGKRHEPGEDYVILLFDDSRSMRIAGDDGVSRGQRLLRAYEGERRGFEDKLRTDHHLAYYRFGKTASRLEDPKALSFDQNESDLSGAISAAVKDLAGAKVSAVVLFSDGVRQAPGLPPDLKAALDPAVPIMAVGVDTETPWRDLELKAVSAVRTNFDKSPVSLTVRVAAHGLKGQQAVVEALEGRRVAASKPLEITDDALEANLRLEFVPQSKGWIACEARVRLVPSAPVGATDPAGGTAAPAVERILENNARELVVDNNDHAYRILYLSGRPNWENKFVRRALEEDSQLKLSSLIRISGPESKRAMNFRQTSLSNPLFEGFNEDEVQAPRYDEAVFIRLGLGPADLANGYPDDAKDLYPYDLVIWGDIEAKYFSTRQMEVTRDFVAKRGGSLMLLGGPRAFSEGHYAGTLVEGMLPVMLASAPANPPQNLKQLFRARPAVDGFLSGVWSLDPDPERNRRVWDELPQLYGLNLFPMLRAGATEMARVASDLTDMDGQPLFAWQRYGQGRTAVIATGETWQWRMETDAEDGSHERFWRQMVRSLVNEVPAPVVFKSRGEELTQGEPARLDFLVRDALFEKREGLNTSIKITPPGRPARELPAEESIAEAGVYSAEFTPDATGMHLIDLTTLNDKGEVVGTLREAIDVRPDLREYRNAQYDADYLQTLAGLSHGDFYRLDRLRELADRIPRTLASVDLPEIHHLWQFPGIYAVLAALFAVEWYLRRRYGLP